MRVCVLVDAQVNLMGDVLAAQYQAPPLTTVRKEQRVKSVLDALLAYVTCLSNRWLGGVAVILWVQGGAEPAKAHHVVRALAARRHLRVLAREW